MATPQRDYYEVLGVPRDADAKAIKDAFRELALKYHPDRNREPGAEEKFKEIAAAYAILSDPKKRAEYDNRGFAGVAGFTPEDLFGGIDFEDIFGGLGGDLGGGLFDHFFGRRRRAGPQPGANVQIHLVIPLERVLTGGEELVRLAHAQVCSACQGSGAARGTSPRSCTTCNGKGQKVTTRQEGNVRFQQIITCSACGGRGSVIEKPCPDCKGRGELEIEETLTVKVPPGIEEGMILRVPRHGLPSREPQGAPGDLHVVVHTAPDARFERRGVDLWRIDAISVPDAVLGTKLEVPTLDGHATVTVPAGSQPNEVLRLRNKGLPELGGLQRGNIYVALEVRLPKRLTLEERELYERLRRASRDEAAKSGPECNRAG